jgi:hypothetical protein
MAPSKTARRSSVIGGKITPETKVLTAVTSPARRLIPLSQGRYVYFNDPITGLTPKLATSSDELADALRESCGLGLSPRIRSELEDFAADHPSHGWPATIARLESAGVL